MKKTVPAPTRNLSVLTVEAEAEHADRLADDLSARFGKAAVQLQRPHANQVWIELYFDTGVEAWQRNLTADAQTSGGLLVACDAGSREQVLACFRAAGFGDAAVIGRMQAGPARVNVVA